MDTRTCTPHPTSTAAPAAAPPCAGPRPAAWTWPPRSWRQLLRHCGAIHCPPRSVPRRTPPRRRPADEACCCRDLFCFVQPECLQLGAAAGVRGGIDATPTAAPQLSRPVLPPPISRRCMPRATTAASHGASLENRPLGGNANPDDVCGPRVVVPPSACVGRTGCSRPERWQLLALISGRTL